MTAHRRALIIGDGSLATAVCAARVALDPETEPLLWPASGGARDASTRQIAATVGAAIHNDGWRPARGPSDADELVLHAGHAALAMGCGAVVWPVFPGSPPGSDPHETPDLASVGETLDRALLITRLVGLSGDGGPSVEAPVADLSDWQLADLAADLDAPVRACWWFGGDGDAGSEHVRWTRALRAVGWAGLDAAGAAESA